MKKIRGLGLAKHVEVRERPVVRDCWTLDGRNVMRLYPECTQTGAHVHNEIERLIVKRDRKRWIRFKPNFGFKLKGGKHYCRKSGWHPVGD